MQPTTFKTLGRLADLRVLCQGGAHDALLGRGLRWTRTLNRDWILEGVRLHQPFLVVSAGDFQGSILEWELHLVRAAGYLRQGQWWRPR